MKEETDGATPLEEGKTCEMRDGQEVLSSEPKGQAETFELVERKNQ